MPMCDLCTSCIGRGVAICPPGQSHGSHCCIGRLDVDVGVGVGVGVDIVGCRLPSAISLAWDELSLICVSSVERLITQN
jgi:hypothetical protein